MTERASIDPTAAIRKVAVIGIGKMGDPMARRILDAGFELTVCDSNDARLTEFADLGARTTITPSDCRDADAVIVLVATADQMRTVTIGDKGLRKGIGAGKPRYLVVMSTVAPKDVRDLEKAVDGTSTHVVDAPVSGGILSAQKGTLTILAGGAEADVAALRPLFEAVGRSIFHCGALGAGQATKIVNNIIAISNMMVSAEAYAIGLANGLALDRLMPALDAGSGRNFLSREPGVASEIYAAGSRMAEDYQALQKINRKDIDLALSIGAPDMHLPATTALRQLLDTAGDETLAHWRLIGSKA